MFPKALLVIATLAIAVAAAPKGGKGGNGQVSCKHGRKSANAAVGGDFPLTRWNDADGHPHTGSAVSGSTSWTTSRRTCEAFTSCGVWFVFCSADRWLRSFDGGECGEEVHEVSVL